MKDLLIGDESIDSDVLIEITSKASMALCRNSLINVVQSMDEIESMPVSGALKTVAYRELRKCLEKVL
jgi:hypothetical protein